VVVSLSLREHLTQEAVAVQITTRSAAAYHLSAAVCHPVAVTLQVMAVLRLEVDPQEEAVHQEGAAHQEEMGHHQGTTT
jgi:hypothetical protein